MIEEVWRWCRAKAERRALRRSEALEHLRGQDDLMYDAGYVAGYRDCAEFLSDWIEESGEVEDDWPSFAT